MILVPRMKWMEIKEDDFDQTVRTMPEVREDRSASARETDWPDVHGNVLLMPEDLL